MAFQYTLSNLDMKDFYKELMLWGLDCPEVILVEEIEDGSDILRREMENGNHLIYLKNTENKLDVLKKELELKEAKVVPAFSFENHNWTNKEVYIWIFVACEIAGLLNIKCPQIIFTAFEDAGNACGEGMLCLPNKNSDFQSSMVEMFLCIAHELRHEWQHINHPDWSEGYVHVESEKDLEAYINHRTEIDAEAYARKLAGIMFDISLFRRRDQHTKKLKARANELIIYIRKDFKDSFFELIGTCEE